MYAAAHLAGDLISRMLPAYGAIAAGFCVGRLSGRDWIRHLSSLLMYVLIPLVVFKNALALNVGAAIGNVALSMTFSTLMVLCAALIVPRCKTDVPRRLAFCAFSYTNIGWFGIPTGLALFGPDSLPILVMAYVGGLIFGNTVGFYFVARDRFSVPTSLWKVATTPALYAFGAGLAGQALGLRELLPPGADAPFRVVTLLMSGCGMMVVGLGASQVRFTAAAIRGTLQLVIWRHIASVFAIIAVIGLFAALGAPVAPDNLNTVRLLGLLPVAGNVVVFAAQLRSDVAAASLIVALSTAISTITVLCWGILLHLG
ncbi:auxin efflux carrier [Methylobacterium sp. GXF4]|nr:auxin efflux carrier [Methylobacterium sp. GXF4]